MTTIMIGKALATVTEADTLTSGMVNAKVKFEFSADWTSSLSKTAIFTAGDVTKAVLETYWEDNVCSIPQECLETSGEILMVGVYGADNANKVAIPTVWATVGKIRKGYEGYEDVSTGTLPIWAQVQSAAAQAQAAAANSATEAANSATEAANSATEAANSATEAAGAALDAKDYAAAAANSATAAETAQSKAEAAQGKAEAAQETASKIASTVEESVTSAENYSKVAESWAVGGTGVRTGEDTNNAKHWAQTAQATADSFSATSVEDDGDGNITIENYNAAGNVTSFNGRVGAVKPATGDYTAEMVGADTSGAAAAVQDNLDTHTESAVVHITAAERTKWNAKQAALTFDTTPKSGSTNPVTSGGIYTALSKKQDASTAITTSNIGSQTVDKASYATDTIAVGTAALRNEYFVSAEATPTTNGQIAWVYG